MATTEYQGISEPGTLGHSWGLPYFAWAFLNLPALPLLSRWAACPGPGDLSPTAP